MGSGIVLGIDVGGTKTHLRAEDSEGRILADVVVPTVDWESSFASRADRLAATIHHEIPFAIECMTVGAHGCDSDADCAALMAELQARTGIPTVVINDSLLLGPAAGYDRCVSLISGTGSIAVGRHENGTTLYAGGWGWLVGDAGSSWGIVRDVVRRLTGAIDHGNEDSILLDALLARSGGSDLRSLTVQMEQSQPAEWAKWVDAVFESAASGSPQARRAIDFGAEQLAGLVEALRERGAAADAVVAAGGVIVNQPEYARDVGTRISQKTGLPLVVHSGPPVTGAVRLAHQQATELRSAS